MLSVPCILLLPKEMGVTGPLFSAPIADIISFIVVVIISTYILRHLDMEHKRKTAKEESTLKLTEALDIA